MSSNPSKFDLQEAVRSALSQEEQNIFDYLLYKMETCYLTGATDMLELRKKTKKSKGDIWENFCKQYLLLVLDIYEEVWLWKELPKEVKTELRLRRREDNGIDIVAKTKDGEYHAVQCKYRQRIKGKKEPILRLADLATFFAMCARSGPWKKQIIMTTCSYITKKIERNGVDKSYRYGNFAELERTDWLKLAGDYVEHTVGSAFMPESTDSMAVAAASSSVSSTILTPKQLREARLLRFG